MANTPQDPLAYVAGYDGASGGYGMAGRSSYGALPDVQAATPLGPNGDLPGQQGSPYPATVISQYANSPTLTQLIEGFDTWINPRADFDAFYAAVWDIDTAQGFGLDVWGRIVGVSRNIKYLGSNAPWVGFAGTGYLPFGQAPFRSNFDGFIQNITLGDADYRTLILLKALVNITGCSAGALNALLTRLFAGRGRCYVQDTGAMTMNVMFEFALTTTERVILTNSGVFPHPAGVGTTAMTVTPATTFGFAGSGLLPFGQGTFFFTKQVLHVA